APSHPHRFLALADVNAAGNRAAAIKADQFFFERSREQHPTKCFQKSLMRRFLGYGGFFPARRRLKHSPILRKIDNRAQKFFCLCISNSVGDAVSVPWEADGFPYRGNLSCREARLFLGVSV